MKNEDKIVELLAETLKRQDNHERELKSLILETREIILETRVMASAPIQQANDSRFLLEKHMEWHEKSVWKKLFGLK